MPAAQYTALSTVTLAGPASSVIFSEIPATYRDLMIVASFTGTTNGAVGYMRVNGDSGGNYNMTGMRGNGSATAAYAISNSSVGYFEYAGGTNGAFESSINHIIDYASTDKHKTWLTRSDNAAVKTEAMVNRWASNAAINSVILFLDTGSIASGSTFSLYGVK